MNLRADFAAMNQNLAMRQNMQSMFNRNMFSWQNAMFNPKVLSKHTFRVTLTDNTVLTVRAKLLSDSVRHTTYLAYEDKSSKDTDRITRIYPKQTRYIIKTSGAPATSEIVTDSCWYFKIAEGKINAYMASAENDDDLYYTFLLAAIQQDKEPVHKFTPALLEPMIKDDKKAYKYFLNQEYYKAIEQYNSDHQ